jgi:hypothetical protein
MVVLKACDRCAGDLVYEGLTPDPEFVCLQCGRRVPLQQREALQLVPARHMRYRRERPPRNFMGSL